MRTALSRQTAIRAECINAKQVQRSGRTAIFERISPSQEKEFLKKY
jgi:hypothetical protein